MASVNEQKTSTQQLATQHELEVCVRMVHFEQIAKNCIVLKSGNLHCNFVVEDSYEILHITTNESFVTQKFGFQLLIRHVLY